MCALACMLSACARQQVSLLAPHLQAELLISTATSTTSPFAREPPPVPEIPDEITGSAQRRSVQESSLSLKEDAHRQAVALQTIREGSTLLALLALGSL